MSKPMETMARRNMRAALQQLTRSVRDSGFTEFSQQELQKNYNIEVDLMVLDEASSLKPSYFAPCRSPIPDPSADTSGEPYKGQDHETEYSFTRPVDRAYVMWNMHLAYYMSFCDSSVTGERTPWISQCVGETPFRGLFKYEQPEFGCYEITYLDGPSYPHVMAVIYNNLVATDDTVLCGELLPILRIMLAQLMKWEFVHQMVSPVLIISLMGLKVRVIEAFFKDQKLVVRPTKMYDFTHGNDAAFKVFAQWYMGQPIGDTVLT
ncbi:hypothetical protein BDV32DRAFT_135271 [Aspergillus pseudonomiae]|uniref:Uncharacterized protein n=1 Tax=Aspergillus pseudonomiae TaxID=1506151 RepID=A0A5N7DRU8_9EURO|nr:uncharacterized protein BDV37DRAFT_109565 [Aspergillus pseudonomiae]KAB8264339.1 hypothetical protein BDV32DRAFT_135271 [Aspergillus pseudonomiae]KAE8409190.1 hypothetical protein BDV37DRAFT_109565 [Aspergillus pseudonomiae]